MGSARLLLAFVVIGPILCCSREGSAPNPLLEPPVELRISEAEVLAWPYRHETSADLDGDGSTERVILAADVSMSSAGVPLWEDGHRGAAIRTALEGWERLLSQPSDLDWLVEVLRSFASERSTAVHVDSAAA